MDEQAIQQKFYEAKKRIDWWVNGIGIHGIDSALFCNMPTERIVELYNVEMDYFRKNVKS